MSKRFRLLVVLALVGVSVYFILPTVQWYFFIPEADKALAAGSREQIREHARGQARGTIDRLTELAVTQGDERLPDEYGFLITTARDNYRLEGRSVPSEWTITNVLAGFRGEQEVFEVAEQHYSQRLFDLKAVQNSIITLGLDLAGGMSVIVEADREGLRETLGRQPTDTEVDQAIELAMTVLTSRIDQFGVTEPIIRRLEGTDQILIEVPGDTDRARVEAYLQGRGSLAFHLVDGAATEALIRLQQEQPGFSPQIDGVPDFVPAGTIVVPYVVPDRYGILELVRYIAIYENVDQFGLPGEYITEAQVGSEPLTNQPTANFVLNREGAEIFATLTRQNVGESLAIVLDGRVRTSAAIRQEIPGGQVQITGFNQEEARNIATVLRTAALPVGLNIVSVDSVSASLGADAVQAGLRSIALGFALVIVFMLIYYTGAGAIADLALIMNLFFIVSILSVFNLTLTLTSIAGIILTVGMAVDANVIIFERIKEEYRLGKSPHAAVKAGFEKAFWTIMDANVTTFIAALFLSQLGAGPVQGFAVTLAVGIVSSMFTALFLSRLIFDFGTEVLKRTKLSLGWGVR
ncbi:MAG: protein translocase subunit SecD [Spirochaetaceae bacterium]|nr:MAG: protein translocase subunit SecD [Spirochaetaceae bacterium]